MTVLEVKGIGSGTHTTVCLVHPNLKIHQLLEILNEGIAVNTFLKQSVCVVLAPVEQLIERRRSCRPIGKHHLSFVYKKLCFTSSCVVFLVIIDNWYHSFKCFLSIFDGCPKWCWKLPWRRFWGHPKKALCCRHRRNLFHLITPGCVIMTVFDIVHCPLICYSFCVVSRLPGQDCWKLSYIGTCTNVLILRLNLIQWVNYWILKLDTCLNSWWLSSNLPVKAVCYFKTLHSLGWKIVNRIRLVISINLQVAWWIWTGILTHESIVASWWQRGMWFLVTDST